MIKILHVIPNLRKGGAERLVLDICRELSKRPDVEVRILVFSSDNQYDFLSEGIKIDFVPSSFTPSLVRRSSVNTELYDAYVREYLPDIIHSHLFEAELITRRKPLHSSVYFTHCHDNIIQFSRPSLLKNSLFGFIRKAYERKLIFGYYKNCINHFVAISKDVQNYLNIHLPKTGYPASLLPNAIELDRFLRKERCLNSIETLELINVGSLVPKKNQGLLLRILNLLKNKGVKCRLHCFGDGPDRETLCDLATELLVEDLFFLHGNEDHIESELEKANLYIHSAVYEPFGLVLLEAMASGLPVVCLDGKGNRDLIRDGVNGFIIEKEDVNLFAEKILWLVNHPEEYSRMSREAIAFARQFDINPYVDRLLELYRSAINS